MSEDDYCLSQIVFAAFTWAAMNKRHNKAFGRVLKTLRTKKQLTQETLGFESSLDRAYISLLERGKRSPTLDTLVTLCAPLGVSLTFIAASIELEAEHDE